jgi:1,4-alpha-glucan branching enzyme
MCVKINIKRIVQGGRTTFVKDFIINSEEDLYLFNNGALREGYRVFGAHPGEREGVFGVQFAVWAPYASAVRVAGDFNGWNGARHPMQRIGTTGVWAAFVPELSEGAKYKFEIVTPQGRTLLKADPFAFQSERRPGTASVVKRLDGFGWTDDAWRERQRSAESYRQPMLIYEVHLGSWKRKGREWFYTYRELAAELVDYAANMGYTHLELLPVAEHPLDASWGYQTTGFFAATSRYGPPEQLMELIDRAHDRGIGVILDWVPGHFCKDDHGLRRFDGSALYEPADLRLAEKPLWGTLAFDFAKTEVQSFLISNALFWLDMFHMDGLRVDAVASMMDRNFDKPEHMRTYNADGGGEYPEAIGFLRKLNEAAFHYNPGVLMMAEDSSDYPLVTAPVYAGGLGFNYKWNMGWMNDMLLYMRMAPDDRVHHSELLTFSMMYAYREQFVLPLSHDEVVHGKGSLLNKMPGDYGGKFTNLRLLFAYMIGHPGKKLLFMGSELAQFDEWKFAEQLDWPLLEFELHRKFHRFARDLNRFYVAQPALWELDYEREGFEWIDPDHGRQSVVSFIRYGKGRTKPLVFVCNFSAHSYGNYRIGVPGAGEYKPVFTTENEAYGGAERARSAAETFVAETMPWQGCKYSIEFSLPKLCCIIFMANILPSG